VNNLQAFQKTMLMYVFFFLQQSKKTVKYSLKLVTTFKPHAVSHAIVVQSE